MNLSQPFKSMFIGRGSYTDMGDRLVRGRINGNDRMNTGNENVLGEEGKGPPPAALLSLQLSSLLKHARHRAADRRFSGPSSRWCSQFKGPSRSFLEGRLT